tara:strand:- start:294 stop:1394 length:1101 start_codon:yes stop_codon:yes gene_type:complete
MSRARTFADLATASEAGSLANRNMIINGNMAIHQRVATDTHNDSAVDRFALVKNGLDTADFTTKHQLITDNPPFSDALEIKCTTADTSIGAAELIRIRARLEANTLQKLQYGSASAKTSTLSFWVKSNLTDTFSVGLTSQDGTKQNIGFTYTIAQANTWQKVILNIPANTSATIDNDNGNGMMIVWGLSVGSNYRGTANTTWADFGQTRRLNGHTANIASSTSNNFYLTGVQWELGDVATPFKMESYAENLARCQRYYYLAATAGTDPMGTGSWYGSTEIDWFVKFPVTMRAKPSLEATSGTNYYRSIGSATYDDFNGVAISNDKSIEGAYLYATNAAHGASGTQGDASIVIALDASAKVALSAEL